MAFALEFLRLDQRFCKPAYSTIPADEQPADELKAFLDEMQRQSVPIAQMSPGRYAVHLTEAQQVWAVRIVCVGDLEDTQTDMEAAS